MCLSDARSGFDGSDNLSTYQFDAWSGFNGNSDNPLMYQFYRLSGFDGSYSSSKYQSDAWSGSDGGYNPSMYHFDILQGRRKQ